MKLTDTVGCSNKYQIITSTFCELSYHLTACNSYTDCILNYKKKPKF